MVNLFEITFSLAVCTLDLPVKLIVSGIFELINFQNNTLTPDNTLLTTATETTTSPHVYIPKTKIVSQCYGDVQVIVLYICEMYISLWKQRGKKTKI